MFLDSSDFNDWRNLLTAGDIYLDLDYICK